MKRASLLLILLLVLSSVSYSQLTLPEGLELKFGTELQFDTRNYIDYNPAVPNVFLLRRIRPDFRVTYLKIFEFRIQPNFAPGSVEIDDAFITISFFPSVKLRGGKFKTPLGLERIQSTASTFFIEGGLTNNLVPNRDIGLELSGALVNNIINYSVGIYNGAVDGRTDDTEIDNNKEFTGRIFLQPFAPEKQSFLNNLGFGAAVSAGNQAGSVAVPRLASYRTSSLNNFFRFRDSVYASGSRLRIVPQAYLYSGRFGFLGEYVINKQNIRRNLSLAEVTSSGWQATASVLLTDDNASYTGVKPKKNFNPDSGDWGAFELALRYNVLDVDDDLFPVFSNPAGSADKAAAWTVGVNWFLNSIFRISINYETTTFEAFGSSPKLPDEKVILTRLQAAF